MNNNVSANGLDRQHGDLSQSGPRGDDQPPKSRYVPPHLRGNSRSNNLVYLHLGAVHKLRHSKIDIYGSMILYT